LEKNNEKYNIKKEHQKKKMSTEKKGEKKKRGRSRTPRTPKKKARKNIQNLIQEIHKAREIDESKIKEDFFAETEYLLFNSILVEFGGRCLFEPSFVVPPNLKKMLKQNFYTLEKDLSWVSNSKNKLLIVNPVCLADVEKVLKQKTKKEIGHLFGYLEPEEEFSETDEKKLCKWTLHLVPLKKTVTLYIEWVTKKTPKSKLTKRQEAIKKAFMSAGLKDIEIEYELSAIE
jgi:hypothetical protein